MLRGFSYKVGWDLCSNYLGENIREIGEVIAFLSEFLRVMLVLRVVRYCYFGFRGWVLW